MIRVGLLQPPPFKEFHPRNLWFLLKYTMLSQINVDAWLTCLRLRSYDLLEVLN